MGGKEWRVTGVTASTVSARVLAGLPTVFSLAAQFSTYDHQIILLQRFHFFNSVTTRAISIISLYYSTIQTNGDVPTSHLLKFESIKVLFLKLKSNINNYKPLIINNEIMWVRCSKKDY